MSFFGEFQVEHILGQKLFKDFERAQALAELGYTRDMPSNLRGLFTSSAIVDQLANAPIDHPFRELLVESGWGTTLHRGGDLSVGGFQQGKNAFQSDLIDQFRALRDNGTISTEQLRYSVDYLSQFSHKLATGEILGENGRPLGVLGGAGTEGRFLAAFTAYTEANFPEAFNAAEARGTGGFDPRTLTPGNLATEVLRGSLDIYHNEVTNLRSSTFRDTNGSYKFELTMPEARYEAVQRLITAANEAGITTGQQFDDQLRTLGVSDPLDTARIRNAGIMTYQDIASGSGLDVSNDPQLRARATAERLAIDFVPANAKVTDLEARVQERTSLNKSGARRLSSIFPGGIPAPADVHFVIDAAFPKGTPWGDAVRMPIPARFATTLGYGTIGGVALDAAASTYQSLDALRYGDYLEAQKHLTGFGARLGFGIAGAEVAMIYTPPHPWLKLGAGIIGGIGGAAFGNSLNEAYYRRLLTPPETVDKHMATWLDERTTPPPEVPGLVLPPPTQKEIDAERARYSAEYDAKVANQAQLHIEKTIADNNRLIAANPEDLWTTAYDLRHPAPDRYLPDNTGDGMLPEMGLVSQLDETPEYQRWFKDKNAALAEAKANGFADVVAAQIFARQKNISLSDPEAVAYKKFEAEYDRQNFSFPEIEAFAPPEHPAPTRNEAWAAVKDRYVAEAVAAKKDAVQYIADRSGGTPTPAELTSGVPYPMTWAGQPGAPVPWSVHDVYSSGVVGTSFFMPASASAGQDTPLNVCGLVTTGSPGAKEEHAASTPDPDDYALRYFERTGCRLPPKGSSDYPVTSAPGLATSCTPIDNPSCEADGA